MERDVLYFVGAEMLPNDLPYDLVALHGRLSIFFLIRGQWVVTGWLHGSSITGAPAIYL
jgi:hypothetical protein